MPCFRKVGFFSRQVDENYRLNENNNFIYARVVRVRTALRVQQRQWHRQIHQRNEFYNQYTVRNGWWENTNRSADDLYRLQIVIWGQSLACCVGDVINPQDTMWALSFANLEQSHIPQRMVHPILILGSYSSNSVEGILIP